MNKKRIKILIVKSFVVVCIGNVIIGAGNIVAAKATTQERIQSEVFRGENKENSILFQENFSTTKNEIDNTWKTWWENEIRPSDWQLRKWAGASSTGNNTPYGKVIEDYSKDGGKYVEVSFNNSVGFFQPDSFVKVSKGEVYKLKFKTKNDGIDSSEPLSVRVEYYDEKGTVLERKDVKQLSGTNNWNEYEVSIGTKKDATKMKVIFVFGNVSSNSKGAKGSFSIDSLSIIKAGEEKIQEYNKALDSIFETMVPNSIIDLNDTQTLNTIKTQVESGKNYWNSMNKSQSKTGLWSDTTSTTNSAHITTQYNRLYDMAVAYCINGSELKGNKDLLNDINSGLEWLKNNRYDGKKFYNNWWDWEIGVPQKLNGILIMLRNEFTDLDILKYTDIIDMYVKDPTMHTQGKYPAVGANRADMCKVVIYSGLLSKNEDRIKLGVSKLDPLFKYVEEIIEEEGKKIDGYYKDGSWIEHGSIPYAGAYDQSLLVE